MMVPVLTGDNSPAGRRWNITASWMYTARLGTEPSDYVLTHMSPLLFPNNATVLSSMQYGGVAVPWSAWTTPIMFQLTLWISFYTFLAMGAALLQEQYVDTESLPFPLANATSDILGLVDASDTEKTKTKKSGNYLTLIMLGFVFYIIWYILFPTERTFTVGGFPSNVIYPPLMDFIATPLYVDFTPQGLFPSSLMFNFDPIVGWFGLLLILPMSVVVSTPIAEVIMWFILPPLLISAGELPTWNLGALFGDYALFVHNWLIGNNSLGSPTSNLMNFGGYQNFIAGVVFAMAFVPLLYQRKGIINSIKKAISGEGGSWISQRMLWAIWGLTGLISIILFTVVGWPIYWTIIWMFLLGGLTMGWTRISAATGVMMGIQINTFGNSFGSIIRQEVTYALGMWSPGKANYNVQVLSSFMSGSDHCGWAETYPMMWNMDGYKLADLANAQRKNSLVAMLLGLWIPLVIGVIVSIWAGYTIGWDKANTWATGRPFHEAYGLTEVGKSTYYVGPPGVPKPGDYVSILIGFIVAFALMFARTRFGGFLTYLTPAGFLSAYFWGYSIWIPCIIVAIIRFTVTRVGGIKMYNEKVYPIGLGMLAGAGLRFFIMVITWTALGLGYVWW
jgi:hypothetical protein